MPRLTGNEVRRFGQMTGQEPTDGVAPHSAALLEDAIVHAPFELEIHRRIQPIIVITQTKLEAVFGAVDGVVMSAQIIGIEVKAVNRVG